MTLTFDSFGGLWPYLFILLAGALPTHVWRWIGVLAGGALRDEGQALIWVKGVATALLASVISQLVLFPAGSLAASPMWLRIAAMAFGWIVFWFARRSVLAGVVAGEALLFGGWTLLG